MARTAFTGDEVVLRAVAYAQTNQETSRWLLDEAKKVRGLDLEAADHYRRAFLERSTDNIKEYMGQLQRLAHEARDRRRTSEETS